MNSSALAAFVHRSSPMGPLTRKPQSLWRCQDRLRASIPLLVPLDNVAIGVGSTYRYLTDLVGLMNHLRSFPRASL
jgi:hypothetical protein